MSENRRRTAAQWRLLVLPAALAAGWLARGFWTAPPPVPHSTPVAAAAMQHGIGCIGHFEPEDGIVRVAGPYYQSRPSVVIRLAVKEGEEVKAGGLIAYLDGKPQLEAQLATARAQLEQARRRLVQTKAGAKTSEVSAQQAEVARSEASYKLAESQYQRSQGLFATRIAAAADLEASRSAMETSRIALEAAKYRLTALTEVRQSDVSVAESDVAVSETQIKQIETQLAALTVLAPRGGRITKVIAHEGEQAGSEGIVELANLEKMVVEAEVYASDIGRVHVGQQACAEMEDSGTRKCGNVISIGAEVRQAAVLPNDPVAYSDAHVVPVRIRISGCGGGSCPIRARVKVLIGTER